MAEEDSYCPNNLFRTLIRWLEFHDLNNIKVFILNSWMMFVQSLILIIQVQFKFNH